MSTDNKFGYNNKETQSESKMATKKTGTEYYIGDISYVTSPEEWQEIFSLYEREVGPECVLRDKRKVFILPTLYGDGSYTDLQNREYWVDSGTIGAIKVSDIKDQKKFQNAKEMELGQVLPLPYDLSAEEVSMDGGFLKFGEVVIDTGGGIEYLPEEVIDEGAE
jgi:hypothetical protein